MAAFIHDMSLALAAVRRELKRQRGAGGRKAARSVNLMGDGFDSPKLASAWIGRR